MFPHRAALKDLSAELITHLLGFHPGDPNFTRSQQYVCSNLFYHRCLSPEPRDVKEQIDGVLLKLAVHGRVQNKEKLSQVVDEWINGPEAEEQGEVKWSVLSLLLQLSYNPTDHHLSPSSSFSHPPSEGLLPGQLSASLTEEELVQQLLDDRLPHHPASGDDVLSEWSDSSDDEEQTRKRVLQKKRIGDQAKSTPLDTSGNNTAPGVSPSNSSANTTAISYDQITRSTTKDPRTIFSSIISPSQGSASNNSNIINPVVSTSLLQSPNEGLKNNQHTQLSPSSDKPESVATSPKNDTSKLQDVPNHMGIAELMKEAARADQWLAANIRQTTIDSEGVELMSEKELVKRVVQCLTCPLGTTNILSIPPATATLSSESVASILKLNVLPVVDKLIALDEYFGASPMLANSLSELDKSSIYTIENNYITTNNKNNVVSGFNYGMPSNSVLSNSTRVKKDNSEGEIWKAFSCGLHLWRHNILCSLDKLMQFINSADVAVTLGWLVTAMEDISQSVGVVYSVLSTMLLHTLPISSSYIRDFRLLGALLLCLETSATTSGRSVLLQLLVHTLRPLLLIMAEESSLVSPLIYRNPKISVKSPSFWHEAYDEPPEVKQCIAGIPGMGDLLPVLEMLRTTAKSKELCTALLQHSSSSSQAQLNSSITTPAILPHVTDVTALEELVSHLEKITTNSANLPPTSDDVITAAMEAAYIVPPYDPFLARYGNQCSDKEKSVICDKDQSKLRKMNPNGDSATSDIERRISALEAREPVRCRDVTKVLARLAQHMQRNVTLQLNEILYSTYLLGDHVKALCAVMLLQPSNIFKGFTAAILDKNFSEEKLNTSYLTMELRECLEKIHPKVAPLFSVVVRKKPFQDSSQNVSKEGSCKNLKDSSALCSSSDHRHLRELFSDEELACLNLSSVELMETKDLSDISVQYDPGWPWNSLLPEDVVEQYNSVLHFCIRLQQALHVLHALNFKDMRTCEVVSSVNRGESKTETLSWRLLRLQLLRHWLLHFCRVVHDHFTTVVLLPFCFSLDTLAHDKPLHHFMQEHRRLVSELRQRCLLSSDGSESPAQLALKQVVKVVVQVRDVWRQGGCDEEQLCRLETSYAACHRFLSRLLSTLASTSASYHHLTALVDVLSSSCPVSV